MVIRKRLNEQGQVVVRVVDKQKASIMFTPRFIQGAKDEGWMTEAEDMFTLHCEGEWLKFRILAGPGAYCNHCDAKFYDNTSAMSHVAAKHSGPGTVITGDAIGYRVDNFYRCERVD